MYDASLLTLLVRQGSSGGKFRTLQNLRGFAACDPLSLGGNNAPTYAFKAFITVFTAASPGYFRRNNIKLHCTKPYRICQEKSGGTRLAFCPLMGCRLPLHLLPAGRTRLAFCLLSDTDGSIRVFPFFYCLISCISHLSLRSGGLFVDSRYFYRPPIALDLRISPLAPVSDGSNSDFFVKDRHASPFSCFSAIFRRTYLGIWPVDPLPRQMSRKPGGLNCHIPYAIRQ